MRPVLKRAVVLGKDDVWVIAIDLVCLEHWKTALGT